MEEAREAADPSGPLALADVQEEEQPPPSDTFLSRPSAAAAAVLLLDAVFSSWGATPRPNADDREKRKMHECHGQ